MDEEGPDRLLAVAGDALLRRGEERCQCRSEARSARERTHPPKLVRPLDDLVPLALDLGVGLAAAFSWQAVLEELADAVEGRVERRGRDEADEARADVAESGATCCTSESAVAHEGAEEEDVPRTR